MERIIWKIQYISPPPAMRYCKKCGVKTEYHSSGTFRINGQNKHPDVWLIYKCSRCNTTWNLTLYSRINPETIDPAVLHRLAENDSSLALQVACGTGLLIRNGAQPEYTLFPGIKWACRIRPLNALRLAAKYAAKQDLT